MDTLQTVMQSIDTWKSYSTEVDRLCALCTMTSLPGKDSHAEEEACARDTNNIKEINTSGYPQFIKLYTVCFSFSFGPRNQKRMKWWSMLAGIEGKSLSNSEKNLMRISKLNTIGRTFKEGSRVFSFSSDAEQFWKKVIGIKKKGLKIC